MIGIESIICRLSAAVLLGGIVGLERERLVRSAGLRTHALVCLGAALFMIVSAFGFTDILGYPHVDLDPSRIAAQVVTGIGFLGAGTIIFHQGSVRGLTTAASVWTVAAIGLAVGGGMYLAACSATALALVILVLIKPLEKSIDGREPYTFRVIANRKQTSLPAISDLVEASGGWVRHIAVSHTETPENDQIELLLSTIPNKKALEVAEKLRHMDGVKEVLFSIEVFSEKENK